jgi:hypothetical protein
MQLASASLHDIGLQDEAAAFRHASEGTPTVKLVGPNQSQAIYSHSSTTGN